MSAFPGIGILKVLHVLCAISWMGSLLTLSHFWGKLSKEEPPFQNRFAHLLKRMYLFIDLPSMILTVVFGALLLIGKPTSFFREGWFHMKMTFVVLLIVADIFTGSSLLRAVLPVKGRGIGKRVIHTVIGILLIGVLVSIYVVKQKVPVDNYSLGKKTLSSYDFASKTVF